MNGAELAIWGAALGLGATVFTDLIGVFRQGRAATHGFYRLVGRWIVGVPRRGFLQADVRNAPPHAAEAALGWGAHILLGLIFGVAFVFLFGPTALTAPKLWQGVGFGLATVLTPWLVFQPAFGWGVAVSKAPDPWRMRLRGVITHGVFGVGLWLCALAASLIVG